MPASAAIPVEQLRLSVAPMMDWVKRQKIICKFDDLHCNDASLLHHGYRHVAVAGDGAWNSPWGVSAMWPQWHREVLAYPDRTGIARVI